MLAGHRQLEHACAAFGPLRGGAARGRRLGTGLAWQDPAIVASWARKAWEDHRQLHGRSDGQRRERKPAHAIGPERSRTQQPTTWQARELEQYKPENGRGSNVQGRVHVHVAMRRAAHAPAGTGHGSCAVCSGTRTQFAGLKWARSRSACQTPSRVTPLAPRQARARAAAYNGLHCVPNADSDRDWRLARRSACATRVPRGSVLSACNDNGMAARWICRVRCDGEAWAPPCVQCSSAHVMVDVVYKETTSLGRVSPGGTSQVCLRSMWGLVDSGSV